jgi:N-acetylmuramoyl-L-alanine amidase
MPARPAKFTAYLLASAALVVTLAATAATPTRVTDVRLWSGPEGTRLVLDLSAPAKYEVFAVEHPDRIVIDLENAELVSRKGLPDGQGPVKAVRSGPQPQHGLRLVLDLDGARAMRSFTVGPDGNAGHRLVVELPPSAAAGRAALAASASAAGGSSASAVARSAAPEASETPAPAAAVSPRATESAGPVKRLAVADVNGRDLVIAVDAGHGGQDPGALGRGGTQEKDVTLAIARRLAAAIDAEPGMRAVLIRDGDYFITLGGRTRKARQLGADMFVSVHADSVRNRDISGSSVYVLSLRGASDEAARWLAESENAADLKGGVSLDDKDDVLASVLLDVTQKESVSSSVEAADSVLASLRRIGTVHRPRVRHAGFVVLKSPDIPSMLVETAFISNATDERRLRDTDHQQRLAEAIRDGVKNYFYDRPPPGTKVAALSAARLDGGGGAAVQTLAER